MWDIGLFIIPDSWIYKVYNRPINGNFIEAGYVQGSYGYRSVYADAQVGKDSLQHHVFFQHQKADGYRNHSAMERNTATYDLRIVKNNNTLSALFSTGLGTNAVPGRD